MGDGRFERELVNTLDACGYVAMRAPSSGSATERALPDVLAGKAAEAEADHAYRSDGWTVADGGFYLSVFSESLAIEGKTTSRNVIYVEPHEVEALVEFAEAFGARPLLGARYKRNGYDRIHYLVPVENAYRTQGEDEGNYAVHKDEAREQAALVVNASAQSIEVTEA
jgi:Holliday junction resolvase